MDHAETQRRQEDLRKIRTESLRQRPIPCDFRHSRETPLIHSFLFASSPLCVIPFFPRKKLPDQPSLDGLDEVGFREADFGERGIFIRRMTVTERGANHGGQSLGGQT